ncbi:hypothetical protein HHL17_33280 [Chitinophaga sp. G-6-1-13]|uniref:Uncharacterized protein n=1 Tax=Chitinophaga fulva TaxID=2728842 RepID=A0A848GVF9_9BACT|nr:hypothetical protein [Chitinophaga fulva]NML42107.1 hypothetical protein [Chitinophaga fulva]
MKESPSVVWGIGILILLSMDSCSRYIDRVAGENKMQINQGDITFYPDSNILIYRSDIGLKTDDVILKPKPFYVKLPKGIKWYTMTNSTSFLFYYADHQSVIINIDLSDFSTKRDSIYEPAISELAAFINTFPLDDSKYNVGNIRINPRRRQCIVRKDAATILLYNINDNKFDKFKSYLQEFRFL